MKVLRRKDRLLTIAQSGEIRTSKECVFLCLKKHSFAGTRLGFLLAIAILIASPATGASNFTASYYTVASCKREGTSGIMANGKRLQDEGVYTAAMWNVPFGTRVLVRNLANGKEVIVTITDRGPAKRLVKKGRIIDLNKAAFLSLAPLRKGIIEVEIKIL
jgi:rare lipoprotein A